MLLTFVQGFITSASLIIPIGAQNAFVIRQGLSRNHLFLTALLCSLIDAMLITLGILGFGKLILFYPLVIKFTKCFAVVFLFSYGVLSLKSAFSKRSFSDLQRQKLTPFKGTVLIILGLSLLNPHVYLDTVILLGSIAAQQAVTQQCYFGLGAPFNYSFSSLLKM